ncbi:hypothetical protein BN14_10870 [Rhizoctonia solani AG-1 IB]|uniref:Transmembrane protein n=1 Tax=Thanatephorus cucumeris (strain AG1-IB / isolate 7/3/14) TaxID=1108050 RepID=M5CGU5_THACB|nr:hypothetical protein BN14_10870 [Rhizoctonia solani AG-1 IB]
MLAFNRLTTVLFFVLSLGFLVSALPTAASNANELAVRHESEQLSTLVLGLQADVDVCINAIGGLKATADIFAQVDLVVEKINTCAAAILALGANLDIDASVQADIAASVGAIIEVIVKLCVDLNAKLGIIIVLGLFAKIDACLQLLLTNLGVCVSGIISLVAKVVLNVGVEAFASVHLGLCASVLGLVGV